MSHPVRHKDEVGQSDPNMDIVSLLDTVSICLTLGHIRLLFHNDSFLLCVSAVGPKEPGPACVGPPRLLYFCNFQRDFFRLYVQKCGTFSKICCLRISIVIYDKIDIIDIEDRYTDR